MGLATRNCENHIGYAELAGADAEKYLATICHVDVVPEGNGWTEDPFKMEIRDGWMIGRGVADDKGPMVATLYALKFLKEEGVSPALSHPRPRRRQRGDSHARCGLLPRQLPGPCVLLHPGRRVPGLQWREGPLRRQAGQPRLQRRHQGLCGRRRHQRCA